MSEHQQSVSSTEDKAESEKFALAYIHRAAYSARPFAIEIKFMRRPKGIKTKKSVSKRFKITATGKVMRSHAGRRHLPKAKTPSAAAASARSPSWIQPTLIASCKICRSATD